MPALQAECQASAECNAPEATILLEPFVVFQLLLFGITTKVRLAAANALSPLIDLPVDEMSCAQAPFESLPPWEQTAARLVAMTLMEEHYDSFQYGALWPHAAAQHSGTERIFVHTSKPMERQWGRPSSVIQKIGWTRVAMRLPTRIEETVHGVDVACVTSSSTPRAPAAAGSSSSDDDWVESWIAPEPPLCIRFPLSKLEFRGTARWRPARLINPSGEVVWQSSPGPWCRRPVREGWPLEPRFLMRLEAGGLAGHVLERSFDRDPTRWDCIRQCVLGIEFGSSSRERPVAVKLIGSLSPLFPVNRLVRVKSLPIPACGGATVASLDPIARAVGVPFGSHIRTSFAYHPLRCRNAAEVA